MSTSTLLGILAVAGVAFVIKKLVKRSDKKKQTSPKHKTSESSIKEKTTTPSPLAEKITTIITPRNTTSTITQNTTTTVTSITPRNTTSTITQNTTTTVTLKPILIKHHTQNNTDWIDALTNNLKNNGYRVFINTNTLSKINHIILFVTPEALDSGWVQAEYQRLLAQQRLNPKLGIIPVINQNLSKFSLTSQQNVINFSGENYLDSFKQLLSRLDKTISPAFDKIAIKLPVKPVKTVSQLSPESKILIEQLFNHFEQSCPPPLILLGLLDHLSSQMIETIKVEAQKFYQDNAYLAITLPYDFQVADEPTFFTNLAQQCGFDNTMNSGIEFEQAIRLHLNKHHPLLLLIHQFENEMSDLQTQLAGICRNLYESYSKQIHILILGGEKLAQLKYRNSHTSLLNIAQAIYLPELGITDVYALSQLYQHIVLNDKIAAILLELSGGHPILLKRCLDLYHDNSNLSWSSYPNLLAEDTLIQDAFMHLETNHDIEQVRRWLKQEILVPAMFLQTHTYQHNQSLQYLYWKNLLTEKTIEGHQRLCWRCKTIQLAGMAVL